MWFVCLHRLLFDQVIMICFCWTMIACNGLPSSGHLSNLLTRGKLERTDYCLSSTGLPVVKSDELN